LAHLRLAKAVACPEQEAGIIEEMAVPSGVHVPKGVKVPGVNHTA
jgi:hypothetical protein